MKSLVKIFLFAVLIGLLTSSCAPSHVSVGVGVGYPGAWGGPYGGPYGPYPGGSIWVGRPVPAPYYPALPGWDKNREFVKIRRYKYQYFPNTAKADLAEVASGLKNDK
ncbi:MAG: hypothetical protein ACE5GL_00315 [Calditrichia bacterium]